MCLPTRSAWTAGEVRVFAPIAPGLKQLSYYYELRRFPRTRCCFPFEGSTPVLEVLVEDPRGTAVGAGLVEVSPVMVEGRPFKRFLAENVSGSYVLSVTAPGSRRRRQRDAPDAGGHGHRRDDAPGHRDADDAPGPVGVRTATRAADAESLAMEIAALDAAFEAKASPTEAARAEHFMKRAQLKGRLSDALAKRDGLA